MACLDFSSSFGDTRYICAISFSWNVLGVIRSFSLLPYFLIRADNGGETEGHALGVHDRRSSIQGDVR